MSNEINLTDLAKRWLGKSAEQVTEMERGVLTRIHHRLPMSQQPAGIDQPRPPRALIRTQQEQMAVLRELMERLAARS